MNKYQIAANATIQNAEKFEGKMTAKMQRSIFGKAIFGRKTIKINCRNQGEVICSFKVCYGTDTQISKFTFDEIAKIIDGEKRLTF